MLKHNYYGNYTAESFAQLPLVLQRFLSYTQYNTTSDPNSTTAPSTQAQMAYAQLLKAEFESVGVKDVKITDKGIVMAYLPATEGLETMPAMGLIAHMDTSPEASGEPAQWQVLNYQGGDIVLNKDKNIVLSLERFPGVAKYAGEQLVVTDGTTLLGADDKAGVAILMGMIRKLTKENIPCGELYFLFTTDEEVGRGMENPPLNEFKPKYAFTFDGGTLGEAEYECFNAVSAIFEITGRAAHLGQAKGKLINAIDVAAALTAALPEQEKPMSILKRCLN